MITRRSLYVGGVFGLVVSQLLLSRVSQCGAQDGGPYTELQSVPSSPHPLKTYTDFSSLVAGILVSANEYGLNKKIATQLEALYPEIQNDLKFAGDGGVLVVARLQVAETEAGSFRSLVADRTRLCRDWRQRRRCTVG